MYFSIDIYDLSAGIRNRIILQLGSDGCAVKNKIKFGCLKNVGKLKINLRQ